MSFKIVIASLLGLIFAGSVAARLMLDDDKPATPATSGVSRSALPQGANGLLPTTGGGQTTTTTSEPAGGDGFMVENLPLFTEASFFGLIGFALGYFSRKVVKLMLIFIALIFVAAQVLQYSGVVTINWQRLIDLLNGFILNLKENDSIGAVLKDRIPTAGALVAGYALGFRKG